MNKLIVQIYEIQEPFEAELMIDAGVDHIGGVVLSENNIENEQLRASVTLIKDSDSLSSLIPLYSNSESIYRTLDYYEPDIIHFCESLSDAKGILPICYKLIDMQKELKARYPKVKIMRSIPIAETEMVSRVPTLEIAALFESVSDFFLTDTLLIKENGPGKEQPVEGFVGITGITCDWEMAGKLVKQSKIPVVFAGGLSPENVFNGATTIRPAGVDSCTQTNLRDENNKPIRFKKDIEKVKRFVSETRRAEKNS